MGKERTIHSILYLQTTRRTSRVSFHTGHRFFELLCMTMSHTQLTLPVPISLQNKVLQSYLFKTPLDIDILLFRSNTDS